MRRRPADGRQHPPPRQWLLDYPGLTHASLMLSAGADLKVTSARLGHSSIGITADLYTHVASKAEKAAAEAFDKHLAPHLHGRP